MKIKKGVSYIKFKSYHNEESVSISLYPDFGDRWFEVDYYLINKDSIYFEAACWNGSSIYNCFSEQEIFEDVDNKYIKKIEKGRQHLINILEDVHLLGKVRKLKPGDCIYYKYVPGEDDAEFEKPWYRINVIKSITDEEIVSLEILISQNYINCAKLDTITEKYDKESFPDDIQYIDETIFWKVNKYIKDLCEELIAEIRKKILKT